MRAAVAGAHFENSILQFKHYLSVMATGILSIAKLKLSITLIKSSGLNCSHTHALLFHGKCSKHFFFHAVIDTDIFIVILKKAR